jgi:geranylgeranyl diphosphate synthase type II
MDAMTRIEKVLGSALDRAGVPGGPPLLAAAMHHAVFPRGARLRARLCVAVAGACGDDDPDVSTAAAAAIELLHCASLVHDDLPCFDNAELRRGRPSVHRAFGEPLAVLAGDALIVLAFQTLAMEAAGKPQRMIALMDIVAGSTGAPHGIAAGQAWECEPKVDLTAYQQAKTGALFAAATEAGAVAAGMPKATWRRFGLQLGEAYQVADDISDVLSNPDDLGKPTGQDSALGRPNAVLQLGVDGALRRLDELAAEAVAAIPACPGASDLRALTMLETRRLLPKDMSRRVA